MPLTAVSYYRADSTELGIELSTYRYKYSSLKKLKATHVPDLRHPSSRACHNQVINLHVATAIIGHVPVSAECRAMHFSWHLSAITISQLRLIMIIPPSQISLLDPGHHLVPSPWLKVTRIAPPILAALVSSSRWRDSFNGSLDGS